MVTIKVNDIPVEQKMRVGSDGEAYFLSELMMDENGDSIGSPLGMSPASSMLVSLFHFTHSQNLSEEAGSSPSPLLENQGEASRSNDKYTLYSLSTQTIRDVEFDPLDHEQAGSRRHFSPHAVDPQHGDRSSRFLSPLLLTQKSRRLLLRPRRLLPGARS